MLMFRRATGCPKQLTGVNLDELGLLKSRTKCWTFFEHATTLPE